MNSKFLLRPSFEVAPALIGKILKIRKPNSRAYWVTRIVETEAYRMDDPASHSCRGWTPRSAPMFENAGITYVYFIYGMYSMLNFVTEPEGTPSAVLIRALEPISGFKEELNHKLLNGPGKLCRELNISREDNRASVFKGRFILEDDGVKPDKILVTPRVGIRESQPYQPWRFIWSGHKAVSPTPLNKKILLEMT